MYDIVGSLPPELLVQVVEYLDVDDILQCQRVSKQWRTIFFSNTVIKPVLRETLTLLGMDKDGISIDTAMSDAMSYFQWRYGLQHARPVKKIFLPWPKHLPRKPDEIQYHSRWFCYSILDRDGVEILNLETGETSTLAGNETGQFQYLTLSDRYLVMGSIGTDCTYLTAWDLHTKETIAQRILSFVHLFTVVEDKVVVTAPQPEGDSFPVFVWDLSSNRIQEFGSFAYLRLCHLDATENVLVAFEIDLMKQPAEVRQTKWTAATGQLLDKNIFYLELPAGLDPVDPYEYVRTDCCITYGHKTVTQLFFETNDYTTIHLEYDYAVDRLSVQCIHCAEPINNWVWYSRSAYLTRDLVYRYSVETGQVTVYNANTRTVTLHQIQLLDNSSNPELHQSQKAGIPPMSWTKDVFGDREVFGLSSQAGVQLWFFNPKFAPDFIPDGENSAIE